MGDLKTAYALSKQRIYRSTYHKKKYDVDDDINFEPDESQNKEREFIEWNGFGDSKEEDSEYHNSFIEYEEQELEDSKDFKKEDNLNNEGVKIMESEKISFIDNPIEVVWEGQFTTYGGFSRINRSMAFGLSNKGVKLKTSMETAPQEINDATLNELNYLKANNVSDKSIKVFCSTIPLNMSWNGYKILYTMFENSDGIHPDYRDRLNCFDEIWIPTEHGKKILEDHGVKRPIFVMPLGVDTGRYNTTPSQYDLNVELKSFVFLSVFKWSYRKGYDLLLKAFMEEFDAEDDVSLLLVSRLNYAQSHESGRIIQDFENISRGINKDEEDFPHVELYDDTILEQYLSEFYKNSDCFVLPSRGEGFCLPICEAAACGLPVIATRCSGHSDFVKEDNSYCIEPEGYAKAEINGGFSELAKACRFYENQYWPVFGEASISKLREHMREIYENGSDGREKKLHDLVHEKYFLDKSVSNVYNRLKEIHLNM